MKKSANSLLLGLRKTGDALLSFMFPDRCVICGDLLRCGEADICPSCRRKATFIDEKTNLCKKCNRPIREDAILCDICRVMPLYFDVGYTCLIYENDVRFSLLNYKFYGRKSNQRGYANIIKEKILSKYPSLPFDMMVCVPSSGKRIKKRGFKHTAVIAKRISRMIGIPFREDAVIKRKERPPQSRLSVSQRFASAKGAYELNKDISFKNKTILLIDDIYTTGATVSEISRILKIHGAKKVVVFTLCITGMQHIT